MIRLTVSLMFTLVLTGKIVYDGSQVFIYNKAGDRNYRMVTDKENCKQIFKSFKRFPLKLTYKIDKEYCPVHLYSHELTFKHLWTLEAHPTKHQYYYIRSTASPDDKLRFGTPESGAISQKTLLGSKVSFYGRDRFGNIYVSWDKSYHEHNLFKFVRAGRGYFLIKNPAFGCLRANPRINAEDCDKARNYISAKWKLIPRIKAVKMKTKIIFGPVDNLQNPYPDGPYTITVQHGVTRTETTQIRDLQSYKVSLESSISYALSSVSASFEFTQEIEKTVTTTEESSWVTTESRSVTVPARSKYAVVQFAAQVEGELDEDSCQILNGNIKIYVSQNRYFKDDDGKRINIYKLQEN